MSENKSGSPLQIHFHDRDWTSLHTFISPDVLPPEYGGLKPEVDFRESQKFLYDNEDKIRGKTYMKTYTILCTLIITQCNIMLNSVRQHNCFITQGSYIGYMFRLLISHLQAYSC